MSRLFSLIGDSNIKRHMNPTNCRDPVMSGCQVLHCGRLAVLAESLRSVRAESNVIILACISNFVTRSEESGSIANRVDPIFREFASLIGEEATKHAGRYYLVSPPMYRKTPLWYRDGLSELMARFPVCFRELPRNVLLMSSFNNPVLDPDGVHLSAYSGLEYVQHLFDDAIRVIEALSLSLTEATAANQEATRSLQDRVVVLEKDHDRLNRDFESKVMEDLEYVLHLFDEAIRVVTALTLPLPDAISVTQEATRVLQDRVVVLEKDHERLRKELEDKSAEDSEYADFQTNLREEAFFTVSGLKRLPTGLSPKEWQEKALLDVQGVLTILMGKEYPIVFVQNGTSKRKDAPATYHVLMKNLEDSKAIRTKFGSFFLGGSGKVSRPEALKTISLQIKVTPAPYGRIVILKTLGQRYLDSNPGSSFKVVKHEARPLLKITPSAEASDRRVQTYNFVEAVRALPTNFTAEECDNIVKRISPKLHGKLRSIFSVISDDMLKKPKGQGQGDSPD